jgi:hypothetical protein
VQIRRDHRTHLFQDSDSLQVDRGRTAGLADVGLPDRVQRALELIRERRRVEKVSVGPDSLPVRRTSPRLLARST